MLSTILSVVVPVVAGGLGMLLFEEWQKAWAVINGLPDLVKQVVVAGISAGLALLTSKLGVMIGADPSQLGNQDFVALVAAALSYIFHLGSSVSTMKMAMKPAPAPAPKK